MPYPIQPVTITTPDGVKRELRFTFGARKRIVDLLGCPPKEALAKYDAGALPELLYACMYDEEGDPPQGLTLKSYRENADPEQTVEMMAAFLGAMTQGAVPKNDLEAMVRNSQREQANKMFGLPSGASPANASESSAASSGILPSANSSPSQTVTGKSSDGSTTAQGS